MAYNKLPFVDEETPLDKDLFDHLQDGIYNTDLQANQNKEDIETLIERVEDFENGVGVITANHIVKQYPVNGVFSLEAWKRYKIKKTVKYATEWGFTVSVKYVASDFPTIERSYTIQFPACTKYDEYLNFRFLEVVGECSNELTNANNTYEVFVIAEVNGEIQRYSVGTVTKFGVVTFAATSATLNGASEIYLVNEDASIDFEDIGEDVRVQLTPEFAQSVDELNANGDTSKLYVLPDGYIWAYMRTEVEEGGYTNLAEPLPNNTGENADSSKWVNGWRFSSSKIEYNNSNTTVSNYITCQNNYVIRINGVTLRSNADRIAIYATLNGAEKVHYAYWNVEDNFHSCELIDGVYVVTLKAYDSYVIHDFRFAMPTPTDASAVIVTVNEEIAEPIIKQEYAWANTGHAFVPANYEPRINALEEKAQELDGEVSSNAKKISELTEALDSKIENIGSTDIPDYWQEHIDEKIETIKNLHKQYGKDCFSFVVLADTHYPANLGKISPLLAKKVMDEADIKYALHCGDWQTRSCHKTKEALLEENEKIEAMFAPIRDRLLIQQGNHEGAYGLLDRDGDGEYINKDENGNNKPPAERESYVHNVTPQEMYEFLYRKVGMIGNVHFDDTGKAYYIDDISNNVRYIGLNTQCNDYELQADGTQKYPTMWIMRFSKSQFDFLINEALVENVTNKTKIVIFGHVPLTQEIIERDLMNGVLKAFKNKTTYSGSCAGEYGYGAVSVNVDFTNAKGTLVGYFHGHIHSDSLNTTKGFPIIGTRSDAKEEYTEELRNERVEKTITEQSFNVFTVTPNTIYATKIGAGEDREVSY